MAQSKHSVNRRAFLKTGSLLGLGTFGSLYQSDFSTLQSGDAAEIAAAKVGNIKIPQFHQAQPIWSDHQEKEMNVTLYFKAFIKIKEGTKTNNFILRMTGSTIARIQVNGQYAGYGPARGPHGWYRIDEWKIGPYLQTGDNEITIEVAGYNSNSYYLLDQPSFLQAEIVDDQGEIIVATSPDNTSGFEVFDYTGVRVQKVQRFSFQRPFIEVYDWTKKPKKVTKLTRQPEVKYLPRRVPYPEFAVFEPVAWLNSGKVKAHSKLANPWRDRSLVNIGPKLKGYQLKDLDLVLSDKIQMLETTLNKDAPALDIGSSYKEGDVQIVDFGANYTGFFGLVLEVESNNTEVAITFDEILTDSGDVNFLRLGTCSVIQWTLNKDVNNIEAFEPQVGRYAKIHCLKGSFKLKKFYLREYAYPEIKTATFTSSDARLDKLFKAAVLTFRENSVDVFTDCPHRERAGWLCDSFFTARSAFDLTGKTDVEQAFYENYQLPEKFKFLPDGMLPMCYPSDHNDGIFIPNWAMWFVVELEEYAKRSPDQSTINGLKRKIEKLMAFFEKYENSDGLLEKLPSWVFVEWSDANKFVQDVNYPSNMLYAAALDAAGHIYHNNEWCAKAKKIRATIIKQSYNGTFFIDNAIRKPNGSLEITTNCSEVCQYFSFFFKTTTPELHPKLWNILLNEFGPNRIKNGLYPEVHKANSFVGNVLRLELLAEANRGEQLLEESVAYNEYMADRTGTLWENDGPYASCNHGFASHLCHVFYRDILGIAEVDTVHKKIIIRFPKIDYLNWVKGTQPIPGGIISLHWKKKDEKLTYTLSTPQNYETIIENASGLSIIKANYL